MRESVYREQLARVLEDSRVKNAMLLEAQRQVRRSFFFALFFHLVSAQSYIVFIALYFSFSIERMLKTDPMHLLHDLSFSKLFSIFGTILIGV